MPNSTNYVEIIPSNPQSVSISRIANSESDTEIIQGRLPAEFGFNDTDNIEMHFYDSGNNLASTVIIPISSGIISAIAVQLPDGKIEEKISIDMTRVQKERGLFISPGTYTVTLNLFSDEIGSYTDKKLQIEEVATSRTELRLGFTKNMTSLETSELYEFVQPSVPRVLAAGFVASTVGAGAGEAISGIDPRQNQKQLFIQMVYDALVAAIPSLPADMYNIGPEVEDGLKSTIDIMSDAIYNEFIDLLEVTRSNKDFNRLQIEELSVLIENAITNAFNNTNFNLYTQGKLQYIDNYPPSD